jgi:phage-related protein
MSHASPNPNEKPLWFAGSARKDLLSLPSEVRDLIGDALSMAQFGSRHPSAKPWKGDGSGVVEIVEDHRSDTFRAVYTVRFERAIYVLRVFQKKSKTGIATPELHRKMIARRLKVAEDDYKERYG